MASQSTDFKLFNGGVTDNYLDAPLNKAQELDNLLIKDNGKLETRYGTDTYSNTTSDTLYATPAGIQRIGSFPKIENDVLFHQSARRFFYESSAAWTELTGPSANPTIAAGTTASFCSWAEWNGHLLLTSDAYGSVMKAYRDNNSVLRVRNAGLPKVTLTACITMANDLKSKFNNHIADTSEHTTAADTVNTVSSSDAYDFPSLVTLVTELLTDYDAHEGDAELASTWLYHVAQEATDHSLASIVAPITLEEVVTKLDDFKSKFNAHDADSTTHGTDSEYQSTKFSSPQFASAGGSGSTYLYYICAKYKYKVGNVDFTDRGPTYLYTLSNVGTPTSNTVTISEIPVIANGTTENFDTTTIVWEIYRTVASGVTAYYLKEVTNGTTSTTDTATDATISATTNAILYTDGGVKDNDPPPQAKYVVVVGDIAWYGHCKEGGQVQKTRLRQSIKFDVDSCPESFYIDLEDEIVGLGAIGIYPIAFCKNHIYRIEGFKDIRGQGVITKREIARGHGGINHLSIVNTFRGVFFGGTSGWYWTDGFEVKKISQGLNTTYRALTNTSTKRSKMYGFHDTDKDRIYWACQSNSSSNDNDSFFVLDLKWPFLTEDGTAVFTTITPSSTSWSPTCISTDTAGKLVLGDRQGYIFEFDENELTDPKIDTSLTPSSWQDAAIVWDYKGPGLNMGDANNNKVATYLTIVADNITPISLQAKRNNEDSGFFKAFAEIRTRDNIVWKDPFAPSWKPTPDGYPWKTFPLIRQARRFPSESLRFLYTQIQLTNANTIIYKSDDYGTGTVAHPSGTTGSCELSGSLDWPSDIVDYFISFESDSYVTQYLVTVRTATLATFVDVTQSSVIGATKKWQIVGVRKRERLNLNSYSIEWEMGTSSHAHYRGETGGNEA